MLARLALRIAAIEALAPHGATSFPTCAGRFVYDSRVDNVDSLDRLETERPLLVVYTEEHDDKGWGTSNVHPDHAVVTLSVEAIVATRGEIEVEGPDGKTERLGVLETGVTDAQREATLDFLEAQVRRVFDSRNQVESAASLDAVVLGVESIESVPFRDAENGVRLAQRSIRFRMRIMVDQWPDPGADTALPEPLLSVVARLPVGSPHRDIVAQFAALAPAPSRFPPLAGVDMQIALGRVPGADDFDMKARAP